MGLITETNAQYYAGQQSLGALSNTIGQDLVLPTWTFNLEPISAFGLPKLSATPNLKLTQINAASNFNVYFAPTATPNTYAKINQDLVYVSSTNTITIIAPDLSLIHI